MILLLVIPVYLMLNVYVFMRTFMWIRSIVKVSHHKIIGAIYFVIYAFFAVSLLSAFVLPQGTQIQYIMKYISNYWIGVMLYSLMFIFLSDVILFILKKKNIRLPFKYPFVVVGGIVIVCVSVVSIYGGIHVGDIKTREYSVTIDKECPDLKIALVSDLHLGYSIGEKQMEKMVDIINQQNPDIVCIAGDIFDNDYGAVRSPDKIAEILKGIKTKYGVYGCWGNHDVTETLLGGFSVHSAENNERDTRFEDLMKKSNVKILEDEAVLVDNKFYVVGRLDYEKTGKIGLERKTVHDLTENLDKTKPIIEIDHEPNEFDEKNDAGVDLDLGGHTHNGQLFPGNITIKLAWKNPWGIIKVGNMTNVTTSGAGVWGPNMRVCTNCEVAIINVKKGR